MLKTNHVLPDVAIDTATGPPPAPAILRVQTLSDAQQLRQKCLLSCNSTTATTTTTAAATVTTAKTATATAAACLQ